jgi:hypothetical protein
MQHIHRDLLSTLPGVLLNAICDFLCVDSHIQLSVVSRVLRVQLSKPGSWQTVVFDPRYIELPDSAYVPTPVVFVASLRRHPNAWFFLRRLFGVPALRSVRYMPHLQKLEVYGGTIPEDLFLLTSLKHLSLRGVRQTRPDQMTALPHFPLLPMTDLQHFPVLQTLNLRGCFIHDISVLSTRTTLQKLDLSYTQVVNVSPLVALTGLRELSLAYTQVEDVSTLSTLRALQILDLSTTPIHDISVVGYMPALQKLYLGSTHVKDITNLSFLTALTHLDLRTTPVADLTALSRLRALRILSEAGKNPDPVQ